MSDRPADAPADAPADPQAAPPPPPRAPALSVKEWIGFGFSTLALLLSAAGFYFGNLRVDDHALARVAELDLTLGDSLHADGDVVARIAFANPGNRTAVVMAAEYQLSATPTLAQGGMGATFRMEALPLVLAPRDTRVVDFRIPAQDFMDYHGNAAPVAEGERRGRLARADSAPAPGERRRVHVVMRFASLDSEGEVHDVWSGSLFTVDVTPEGIVGYERTGGPESYPAVDLFR